MKRVGLGVLAATAICATNVTWALAIDKGDQAPQFTLDTLDNKKLALSDLKGKIVYLDFWASWCGPCRISLPFMKTLQEKFGGKGLEIVAVNLDSSREKAENALKDVAPTYKVVLDPQSSLPELYQPLTMPSSFLIGKDGKVLARFEGFSSDEAQRIETSVANAFKEEK